MWVLVRYLTLTHVCEPSISSPLLEAAINGSSGIQVGHLLLPSCSGVVPEAGFSPKPPVLYWVAGQQVSNSLVTAQQQLGKSLVKAW